MRRAGKRWFALLTVREKILYSLEGMGIAAIAGFLCFRSIWTLTALPPAAVVFLFYQERQKKERMLLARQIEFKNLLADLYSTTAAGGTLEKALRDAVKEMKRSGGRYPVLMPQMERVILEMDRNVPAEAALERFAEASEDPEIRHFVQVLKVAARSGGSLPDIIGRTAEMAAVRMEMNAEIETLLAGRKALGDGDPERARAISIFPSGFEGGKYEILLVYTGADHSSFACIGRLVHRQSKEKGSAFSGKDYEIPQPDREGGRCSQMSASRDRSGEGSPPPCTA